MNTFRHSVASLAAVSLVALNSASAGAQTLIRPTTASASSTFSTAYAAANTINGSGLPANFTPGDVHANYTSTSNHWTTRRNETLGMSITWGFATPQTVNRFYMWNHRSNGVAANGNYAVTRFDLEFRDAAGTLLSSLTNLTAESGIAFAQSYCLSTIAGVSTVSLTVRATADNNSSPFTGLAEVAFANVTPCGSADIAGPGPTTCPDGELTADDVILFVNRFVAGNPASDIAGPGPSVGADGELTADDVILFISRFTLGCV